MIFLLWYPNLEAFWEHACILRIRIIYNASIPLSFHLWHSAFCSCPFPVYLVYSESDASCLSHSLRYAQGTLHGHVGVWYSGERGGRIISEHLLFFFFLSFFLARLDGAEVGVYLPGQWKPEQAIQDENSNINLAWTIMPHCVNG